MHQDNIPVVWLRSDRVVQQTQMLQLCERAERVQILQQPRLVQGQLLLLLEYLFQIYCVAQTVYTDLCGILTCDMTKGPCVNLCTCKPGHICKHYTSCETSTRTVG